MASDEHEARKIQLVMELRRLGLEASGVIDAMERVPRHLFVPRTFQEHAYDNTALPIACGQTISQPSIVAMMTAALALDDRCTVLEVGTGSGYQTAVLAQIARRVYTIERFKDLLREAEQRFAALHLSNITTRHGDGSKGWPEAAPFDRILVTAAATSVPDALIDQLKFGGVLVIPVGESVRNQTLLRIIKTPYGLEQETLSAVRFVPLVDGVA
ncbi:MAG: protein-L-isoaspartate(D-aspartate) O-methyltransferase [Alphaproteobacteria bacterium]|nr:protein-L-isoaspartate(D-aspartate) O-methyltransferase [Alphaproteobacteria bacterium]